MLIVIIYSIYHIRHNNITAFILRKSVCCHVFYTFFLNTSNTIRVVELKDDIFGQIYGLPRI